MTFFSDRDHGIRPRDGQTISPSVRRGFLALVEIYVSQNFFARAFPEKCPDGRGICGTLLRTLEERAEGLAIHWGDAGVSRDGLFDLIEFCAQRVAAPLIVSEHSFFGHNHLDFDVMRGQMAFREDVNQVFARNGLALELSHDNQIHRLLPPEFQEDFAADFRTGDAVLDSLLQNARAKYLGPRLTDRRDALEKLWDAWERLKTLDDPSDKSASVRHLIAGASREMAFQQLVEDDARTLTAVGNRFMIRHSEVGKIEVETAEEADYLFQRLFAMIRLLLRTSGRTK